MFILEVMLMNPPNTSREEIMRVSRKIVSERGLPALNMRALAKECGIALGTLYNYYSDKDELVVAAIESVWQDILEKSPPDSGVSFSQYITQTYAHIIEKLKDYPDFLAAHSISVAGSVKGKARGMMERFFGKIRSELHEVLMNDKNVDRSIFSETFREENLIGHILDTITISIINGKPDCATLTEILDRLLYR
jgi:AcrR family transcriptional regulator